MSATRPQRGSIQNALTCRRCLSRLFDREGLLSRHVVDELSPDVAWRTRRALWSRVGVGAVVAIAAAGLAYSRLIVEFFQNLWVQEYYQHFPFVLGAFIWLLATRLSEAMPRLPGEAKSIASIAAGCLAFVAWGLLAIAYPAHSPWLAYVSLVLLIGAGVAVLSTRWEVEGLWGVWFLLWVIVPLPQGKDLALVTYLQRVSSRASSFVLDVLGVSHLMEGNKLMLPTKQFFVTQACSGIISIMSIIACAAIYGVWRKRHAIHIVTLILAGVAWATVMNTFRISSIAVVYDWWGVDWSDGTPHQILSLCVFTLTFLALVSTDVLLAGVFCAN